MTDATYDATHAGPATPRKETVDLPRPNPFVVSGPVLIGDAVTPVGGGTMLSLLWRRSRDED